MSQRNLVLSFQILWPTMAFEINEQQWENFKSEVAKCVEEHEQSHEIDLLIACELGSQVRRNYEVSNPQKRQIKNAGYVHGISKPLIRPNIELFIPNFYFQAYRDANHRNIFVKPKVS